MYDQIIAKESVLPKELLSALPSAIRNELYRYPSHTINEIRLRVGGICSVNCDGKEESHLPCTVSREEMDTTVRKLCDGSVYAFRDTISKGYISLKCGVRVGVGGRAVCEDEKLIGVYDISSLCIRIPRHVAGLGENICRLILERQLTDGVLIYSPPGVGKTTLLRSITEKLSSPSVAMRTVVIDTKGELAFGLPASLCCDILSGYPKGYGIELAIRSLNPQLIVCDEIGGDIAEANAIKAALNSGVPLLASAHASELSAMLRRPALADLHRAACFGYYVGIQRKGNDYAYSVNRRSDGDRYVV